VKHRLTEALNKADADYAEIRYETNDGTTIAYRGEELETADSSKFSGGIVRACTKGGWGLAVFDSLDDLRHQVAEACRCAKLVGEDTTQLAALDEPVDASVPARLKRDFRGVSFDEKLAQIRSYNDIILKADPAIETSQVRYSENFRTVHFASTRGACFMEERPRVILIFVALGRDGNLVQPAYDSVSSATDYDAVKGQEALVAQTARRAAALLKTPPAEGGTHTVVLNQRLGGVFAHEAFGHLSEADFLYENPKMRGLMHLGREMGTKELNIVDDGSIAGLLGSQSFDDEGTPTGKHYLIREGVLAGHLHSAETAGKMGASPTGNARAIARGYPPIVRMTNTYIESGTESFEGLLSGIDRGIYACDMKGGQTMMEMFTFSAAYGYRIENGQVGELVRDITLTGNVFQTLYSIDGFADDLRIIESGGGCGKGGQGPLPVTFGSPHLRIRNVVVGGA